MRILVIGGSGFLGHRLIGRLSEGENDLVAAVRATPNSRIPRCSYITVDELTSRGLSDLPPFDVIINAAMKRSSKMNPVLDSTLRRLNFEIPFEIIRAYSKEDTLVINTSTYIQNFGGVKGHTVEGYAASKELLSNALEIAALNGDFRTIDLYLFTLFGPGDRNTHLVPLLLSAIKNQTSVSLSGGNQLINLLYIDDAVDNIVAAFESEYKGYSAYHLWEPNYFSIRDLVSFIEDYFKKSLNVFWGDLPYNGHEMFEPWAIPLQKFPLFSQNTSLSEGLERIRSFDLLRDAL